MTMIATIGLLLVALWCATALVIAVACGRAFAAGSETPDVRPTDLTLPTPRSSVDRAQGVTLG